MGIRGTRKGEERKKQKNKIRGIVIADLYYSDGGLAKEGAGRELEGRGKRQ
jgi:hypothetical protein